MRRIQKGILFILIAFGLTVALLLKSQLFRDRAHVALVDRLPTSDILLRGNVLDLSKEMISILYKYKLPIREFATSDFLLSQGKQFGINVQSEAYLFLDKDAEEWGLLISVNDSSKLINLVNKFRRSTKIVDSSSKDMRILCFRELSLTLCYQQHYAMLYSGKNLARRLVEVSQAKEGGIDPSWKRFLSLPLFKNEKLVAYSESPLVQQWGFDYVVAAHNNDSLNIHINLVAHTPKPHGIELKRNNYGLPLSLNDTKAIELHLDTNFKQQELTQLLSKKLFETGKKIGFPTGLFLQAWDGNLSFREGGLVRATQRLVVTEFDEDFNPKEVIKNQEIQVPGYSLFFGSNTLGKKFIQSLFAKGILRNEEDKLRFLFSPLLRMKKDKTNYYFSSSSKFSPLVPHEENFILWTKQGATYCITLDTMETQSMSAHFDFPSKVLVKYFQKKKSAKF